MIYAYKAKSKKSWFQRARIYKNLKYVFDRLDLQ